MARRTLSKLAMGQSWAIHQAEEPLLPIPEEIEPLDELMSSQDSAVVDKITAFLEDGDSLRQLSLGQLGTSTGKDVEERESEEAVMELEGLLTPMPMAEWEATRPPSFPEQSREVPVDEVPEEIAAPVPRGVPRVISVVTHRAGSLPWDMDVDDDWYGPDPPKQTARAARRQRNRARRRNPRHHFEKDDIVSGVVTPPRRMVEPIPVSALVRREAAGGASTTSVVRPTGTGSRPKVWAGSAQADVVVVRELRAVSSSQRREAVPRYPIKTRGAMFGGLKPIPTRPDIDPPGGVCFNCWPRGHTRLQCQRPAAHMVCYNCGRRGVDLSDCPRCSEVHRAYLRRVYGSPVAGALAAPPGRREIRGRESSRQEAGSMVRRRGRSSSPLRSRVSLLELSREGRIRRSGIEPVGSRAREWGTAGMEYALCILDRAGNLPPDIQRLVLTKVFGPTPGSRWTRD